MKKWLALLLAAMMALALVACGDTPANNDNDNKDNDTKTYRIVRAGASDPCRYQTGYFYPGDDKIYK